MSHEHTVIEQRMVLYYDTGLHARTIVARALLEMWARDQSTKMKKKIREAVKYLNDVDGSMWSVEFLKEIR